MSAYRLVRGGWVGVTRCANDKSDGSVSIHFTVILYGYARLVVPMTIQSDARKSSVADIT